MIPDENHTNSWVVNLFVKDSGDIEIAKEDPIGKIAVFCCHYHA